VPACDRQTDIRTHDDSIYRAIIVNSSLQWTCMSVRLIRGRKCMLAASRAAPGEWRWVCAARSINLGKIGQTDGRTDGRQADALCLPLDAASVINFPRQRLCTSMHSCAVCVAGWSVWLKQRQSSWADQEVSSVLGSHSPNVTIPSWFVNIRAWFVNAFRWTKRTTAAQVAVSLVCWTVNFARSKTSTWTIGTSVFHWWWVTFETVKQDGAGWETLPGQLRPRWTKRNSPPVKVQEYQL